MVFKNFRDRWVGATESNLEKIFSILRALGQVVVFVDEADQAAGTRDSSDGDSGLSGRVYAMLAKEMSDTRNRGKIVWVFATSRPDLLEVDLKRQGRLDVHIPLFATADGRGDARVASLGGQEAEVPAGGGRPAGYPRQLPVGRQRGRGRAGAGPADLRAVARAQAGRSRQILSETIQQVRPSAHTRKLEYMDLVAVKECTDVRFLPEKYRALGPEEVEQRIDELRRFM